MRERTDLSAADLLRQALATLDTTRDPSFAELEAMVIANYKLNGRRSLGRMEAALRHLKPYFRDARIADYRQIVARYTEERALGGASNATVLYELSALRRALSLAVRAGLIPYRPVFNMPKVSNARQGWLSATQIEAIAGRLPDPIDGIARFCWWTGWRKMEVVSLTWDSVEWGANVIRLDPGTTKTGEGRTWPFGEHPGVFGLLQHRSRLQRGLFVFHRDGEMVKDFRGAWTKACTAAGCPGALLHDTRRSCVRAMERARVPRSIAMALIGHKTESIYLRYAIRSEEDLARGVRLVAAGPSDPKKRGKLRNAF